MKRFGALLGVALALLAAPVSSEAVVVTDAFLFSDWSQPANESGVPFSFTPTTGVELALNGSGVATSFSEAVGEGPFEINRTVSYTSHSGIINFNEGVAQGAATMGPRVNSEVQVIDDVGFIDEGGDESLNVDFSESGSNVIFALPVQGVTRLMVAEDAGLDAFKLELCSDATCTTPQTLFDGFGGTVADDLLDRDDFDSCDFSTSCSVDQVYMFVLDETAFGWIRISETGNLGTSEESATLEIDFIGNAAPADTVVPEPSSMLLLGTGLLGAAGFRSGRKNRKA